MLAFPNALDTKIADLLISLYRDAGRHDDAIDILWRRYEKWPCLNRYQSLNEYTEPIGAWAHWRERALTLSRAQIDSPPSRHRSSTFIGSNRPELVRILLWDGDADAAWAELQKGGCGNELWVRVAEAREEAHPGDALKVYRDVINRVVADTSNGVYDEPVRLVHRIRAILQRQGKDSEFAALIAQLRQEFKRKRNFMLALDGIEKK